MTHCLLRKIRVIKIYLSGKYKLLKAVHRWRVGQIFRDLQLVTPDYWKGIIEKYGNHDWTLLAEKLGSHTDETPQP